MPWIGGEFTTHSAFVHFVVRVKQKLFVAIETLLLEVISRELALEFAELAFVPVVAQCFPGIVNTMSDALSRMVSWSYDMEGHAKKYVERYCEFTNKTTEQFFKVATPCMDDHQFKEEENGSVGELSTVCSQMVLKMSACENLAIRFHSVQSTNSRVGSPWNDSCCGHTWCLKIASRPFCGEKLSRAKTNC